MSKRAPVRRSAPLAVFAGRRLGPPIAGPRGSALFRTGRPTGTFHPGRNSGQGAEAKVLVIRAQGRPQGRPEALALASASGPLPTGSGCAIHQRRRWFGLRAGHAQRRGGPGLAFRVDDLGALFPLRLGLPGHGPLHAVGQLDVRPSASAARAMSTRGSAASSISDLTAMADGSVKPSVHCSRGRLRACLAAHAPQGDHMSPETGLPARSRTVASARSSACREAR